MSYNEKEMIFMIMLFASIMICIFTIIKCTAKLFKLVPKFIKGVKEKEWDKQVTNKRKNVRIGGSK